MITVKYPLIVILVFLWVGFVCAISFMEAWLKFKAPGVTVPVGLGIGKLVFGALNKAEWVFAIAIGLHLIVDGAAVGSRSHLLFVLPFIILLLQTIWLLPALDARANLLLQDIPAPSSNLHFYFVAAEVIKVISLSAFGISLFKQIHS
ncbi:hypothetical protein [Niabella soli]|uniref:DUF4149 domain-containing protein n=1 Tax=Niabella soli DSM 19437 TaxID=929713 RepID=W0F1J6_9BACT|nr:hypothetical protein [Niabella soli]AHF16940.1 hypothetical protein NIASO_20590 [Niabella soli DSM 19437]